eukprot:CAMPEP_0167799276 /NCGR_PEP_ID=MMETSP0111_2-20121227/16891_1 /TAXON_ID=91324 /ORGANISM="Lotharella globosa, Strain CCCM811" /LENGTH=127 /DNA_ID=CAMNT_0007694017 /DNA_START=78 /DNA_END=461 /DNA_ORIENTATION=-
MKGMVDAGGGEGGLTAAFEALVTRYFEAWNRHDVKGIRELLSEGCTLDDWEVSEQGADAVARANGKIFEKAPEIQIDVVKTHVSLNTSTVCCEIIVKPTQSGVTKLKVLDVLEIERGKISAVRAYKR